MRMIRSMILAIGIGVGLLLAGCGGPPAEKEAAVRPVKIHAIGSLEPEAIREYPGTIRALQTAEMGFEVPGRIIKLPVKEGDPVEKDAELAQLDPTNYEAEKKVAVAKRDKAQADLKRSLAIQNEDPGAISEVDVERDRLAAAVTEAELEIADKAANDTKLVAPFSGVMARKFVEDFANVQAKEPVLVLQDISKLEIEVAVPERDFVRRKYQNETKEEMSKRLAPKVIVSSLPDREFPATIKEYATMADPVTRTFSVKLNFENPEDVNILPGMTARVRIVVDPESAWSVPVTATQADENEQPYVWKVDPESMKVTKSPVELGPLAGGREGDEDRGRVLLKSGVEKGDLVAISGVTALREGMQVRKFDK